jgi:hypothetical protein
MLMLVVVPAMEGAVPDAAATEEGVVISGWRGGTESTADGGSSGAISNEMCHL